MPQLNVQILRGLRKSINQIINDPDLPDDLTMREVVNQALTAWLDKHEGKETGNELRGSGRGEMEQITAKISDDLEKRLKKELKRRRYSDTKPVKKRRLVEGALIAWVISQKRLPGIQLEENEGANGDPKPKKKKKAAAKSDSNA